MSLKSFESRPNPGEAESLILLSNRIRRRTVEEVRQEGEEVTVTALTARLATGNDESPTAAAIGQLESELREEHLPRLDAAGAVDFTPAADTVRRGVNFDRIAAVLDSTTPADLPWVESSPSTNTHGR
jgi:hypothetical protein